MKETKWNGGWLAWPDRNSFALIWGIPEDARPVTLPHDGMITERPNAESRNGTNTGYRDGADWVYVKNFNAPDEWRGGSVLVKFEGVYMNAMVYINGVLAANRPYGYSQFIADIGPHLRFNCENELRVLVKNSNMPNSRWYSGTGIYRDVYLLTGGVNHIAPDGVRIDAGMDGTVRVRTEVICHSALLQTVFAKIFDREGNCVGTGTGTDCVIHVENPSLWSADSHALYKCEVSLNSGEDTAYVSFGFRSLELDAANGLRVNGVPVKLRGACIHHDNGPIGAAEYDGAALRRIRKLKEAGFNAIRMAHHPISANLLRACDLLGMYVMDEAFDMWTRPKSALDYALYFSEWWERDLLAMVMKDYNHPCVIMYSLGNEIPETGNAGGVELLRRMTELIKQADGSRYTLCGINAVFAAGDRLAQIIGDVTGSGNVNEFMTVMDAHIDEIVSHPVITEMLEAPCTVTDIAGYNYMTARYLTDAEAYKSRVMVGSETYPPQIARNWEIVKRLPQVIGDFTWTGWDYIGEAGVGIPAYRLGEGGFGAKYPCQLAYCGDIDITGFRRPLSYYREIVFGLRSQPYISVQDPHHYGERLIKTPWVMSDSSASWNWRGCEGKPVVVEVYANCGEAELFQDGVSLGCKRLENCVALFETVYRPGVLRAVAYSDGTICGEWELCSAAGNASVHNETHDEGELIYAELTLLGDNGQVYTDETRMYSVSLTGSAELLGFASANPKTDDYYPDAKAETFNGRALAVFRRTGEGRVDIAFTESAR
jgi:beta-galactosidase